MAEDLYFNATGKHRKTDFTPSEDFEEIGRYAQNLFLKKEGAATHKARESRKQEFVELCKQGYTLPEIAAIFDVSIRVLVFYMLEVGIAPALGYIDNDEVIANLNDYKELKKERKRKVEEHIKGVQARKDDKYDEDIWLD